jgi:hypothetical protein
MSTQKIGIVVLNEEPPPSPITTPAGQTFEFECTPLTALLQKWADQQKQLPTSFILGQGWEDTCVSGFASWLLSQSDIRYSIITNTHYGLRFKTVRDTLHLLHKIENLGSASEGITNEEINNEPAIANQIGNEIESLKNTPLCSWKINHAFSFGLDYFIQEVDSPQPNRGTELPPVLWVQLSTKTAFQHPDIFLKQLTGETLRLQHNALQNADIFSTHYYESIQSEIKKHLIQVPGDDFTQKIMVQKNVGAVLAAVPLYDGNSSQQGLEAQAYAYATILTIQESGYTLMLEVPLARSHENVLYYDGALEPLPAKVAFYLKRVPFEPMELKESLESANSLLKQKKTENSGGTGPHSFRAGFEEGRLTSSQYQAWRFAHTVLINKINNKAVDSQNEKYIQEIRKLLED